MYTLLFMTPSCWSRMPCVAPTAKCLSTPTLSIIAASVASVSAIVCHSIRDCFFIFLRMIQRLSFNGSPNLCSKLLPETGFRLHFRGCLWPMGRLGSQLYFAEFIRPISADPTNPLSNQISAMIFVHVCKVFSDGVDGRWCILWEEQQQQQTNGFQREQKKRFRWVSWGNTNNWIIDKETKSVESWSWGAPLYFGDWFGSAAKIFESKEGEGGNNAPGRTGEGGQKQKTRY